MKLQAPDIASGFQESVVDVLSYKLLNAADIKGCDHISLVGGVAANNRLREKIRAAAKKKKKTVHIPPVNLCGDNAAMIAAAGFHHLVQGRASSISSDVYSRVNYHP
jgi:N6-L-threonylcarbamoyladenine synthase